MARIPKPLDGEREARLLRVAAEAFLADGFERASLNRIIEDAGIAKSSFYHYFTDKRALYDHLLETLRTHLTARLARMDLDALTRETFWSELDRTLRGLGAAPDDSPARLALARLFHANSDLDEGFRRLRAKLLGSLDAVLRRGRELGAVRADLPIGLVVEVAAGWLFGIDRWAAARRSHRGGRADRDRGRPCPAHPLHGLGGTVPRLDVERPHVVRTGRQTINEDAGGLPMRKQVGAVLIVTGALFFLNAIFGRYVVLPGYLESLEAGRSSVTDVAPDVEGWRIARYLLWAYSFKLGLLCLLIGAALRTAMRPGRFWLITAAGLAYVGFAYMPLPAAPSIAFGVAGGIMTVLMALIVVRWARERARLPESARTSSDHRMAGLFFFAMATYTICGFTGTRTFALQPEKMIEYGLEADAGSFAFHLLIELVLGWAFTYLGYRAVRYPR